MLLQLTDVSDEPLHHQISRQIRAKILAGVLADGDSLPSIRGLAKESRVSVITVQRAYDDLDREGLIQARRGKGFFVRRLDPDDKTRLASERFRTAPRTRRPGRPGRRSQRSPNALPLRTTRRP